VGEKINNSKNIYQIKFLRRYYNFLKLN